jgi:hypothetical protein
MTSGRSTFPVTRKVALVGAGVCPRADGVGRKILGSSVRPAARSLNQLYVSPLFVRSPRITSGAHGDRAVRPVRTKSRVAPFALRQTAVARLARRRSPFGFLVASGKRQT